MDPIKVVLVDDEPLARENLRDLLSEYSSVAVAGEAGNIVEASRVIEAVGAEAVFLDIQMPGGSGFDLLPRLCRPIQIVFVTAYDRYAIRAFEINAVDYLLKPIERFRLGEAVRRLGTKFETDRVQPITVSKPIAPRLSFTDEVLINAGVRCFFMPVAGIIAVIAAGDYVRLLVNDGRDYILRETVKRWRARLPEEQFAQLDRSLIVNLRYIGGWRQCGRKMEITLRKSQIKLILGRSAAIRFQRQYIDRLDLAMNERR